MNTLTTVMLIAGTIIIMGISWRSLLHPRSHGFYRFFAWEGIFVLVLINAQFWIVDPVSIRQIISWFLLTASIYPVAHGTYLLRVIGRPTQSPTAGTDFAFEQTSNLVTIGVYKYIRHPLYASLLYLAWGAFLKDITWLTTGIVVLVSIFLFATAKAEEKENAMHFGEEYKDYSAKTKMFIPFIW
jgi:protein-S-isoprenylcysteine O-methyltransferase Ste14